MVCTRSKILCSTNKKEKEKKNHRLTLRQSILRANHYRSFLPALARSLSHTPTIVSLQHSLRACSKLSFTTFLHGNLHPFIQLFLSSLLFLYTSFNRLSFNLTFLARIWRLHLFESYQGFLTNLKRVPIFAILKYSSSHYVCSTQ